MKTITQLCVLSLAGAIGVLAQSYLPAKIADSTGTVELEKMPSSLETRFALSALPPTLREKATVYHLDPARGYVLEHAGTNGQHCFVERTEWRQEEFRDDLYTAICYDSAGAKSQMRVRFDVAKLRAEGLSPHAVKMEIEKRLAGGVYRAPERAGFSYMVAPLMRTYMSVDPKDHTVMTMPMPHIMYYAPNVSNGDVGGIPPLSPYPFVFEEGELGYFIQRLGDSETAAIIASESALVKDLCSWRSYMCLAGPDHIHAGE